ncbi:5-formyltetrahydrofolate cyclo-ligase [Streptomyces sp. TS71-3]|uniref:5-formyltetrahydrofolate cyclo-ligase n=1 Tax=Streptomyces sp. TS71-3 TaxID=2733862 RepID=UPI001B2DD5E3|nr:5-formyltetrahydrofolate cyclo-ligase [Streptomyces sp. TS71-3]GHJ39709.1 5-formyltetrahydrofolate cyclo-ligase [Streptomyces sp. TS71-3]
MHDRGKKFAEGSHTEKRELRRGFLSARDRFTDDDVQEAERLLARRALELPEMAEARAVAAYVSVGREPGTPALLDALHARDTRVLLPVLRPDHDLDWGEYQGAESVERVPRPGRLTLLEPRGERLGPEAVLTADVVLLPGLAVDARGTRLGRGGGSYDRVLARLAAAGATPALVVLLYDAEIVERLPGLAHDRPVQAAVTPSGVRRF